MYTELYINVPLIKQLNADTYADLSSQTTNQTGVFFNSRCVDVNMVRDNIIILML